MKTKPFIMSTVPKSGTHLLHQILNGMPDYYMNLPDTNKKFFFDVIKAPDAFYKQIYNDHEKRMKDLGNNEFGLGHIRYTKAYHELLKTTNLKHIFLYRDPRDVLVSLGFFIKEKWNEHPLYETFQNPELKLKDRVMTIIHGTDQWPDFNTYMSGFYDWLDVKDKTLHISFEQLMQSQASQHETVMNIIRFIWEDQEAPLSYEKMAEQMINKINPEKSATFRSGKIGNWLQVFDQEIADAFQKNAGSLIKKAGY